jgi:signal transduction histidine kinase
LSPQPDHRPRTLVLDFGGPAAAPPHARARWHAVAALAIVPMVAITLWLGSTSNHLQRPMAAAVYWSYLVAAPMTIGLLWSRRRPASRFGPLLVLFGALVWVASWQAADAPLLFDIGVLAEGPFFILTFYLFLAFPMGRLEPPAARWLMWALVAGVLAFFLPWALFSPVIAGGGPLTGCAPDCPPNALQIASAPKLVEVTGKAETYAALAVCVGVLVVYGWRLLTASRPQRRALMAVAVTSLLFLPAYFVTNFAAWVLYVDPATVKTLQWGIVVTRVLLPLGFLIALLQAGGFAARALQTLVERLAARPSPERWRQFVAEALDDPTARLGYRDPTRREFREPDGSTLTLQAAQRGRAWVRIDTHGQAVAAMELDETLTENPELVRAAASATLVAVENGALEGELRASNSRVRDAKLAERERIGRDLHDSAQQRLIALRIHLMILGEQLGQSEEREVVDRLGDEVDQTIDELRDLVNGAPPALLADRGVGAALEAVARAAPVRVSVYDDGLGRRPEHLETTIYYCCVECVQNAAKHAGPQALVTIRLEAVDGRVSFSVEDDGVGFDPAAVRRGTGLLNLAGRVREAGGDIRVESRQGQGTRVRGELPA